MASQMLFQFAGMKVMSLQEAMLSEKTCFSSSKMELFFSLRYAGILLLLPKAF